MQRNIASFFVDLTHIDSFRSKSANNLYAKQPQQPQLHWVQLNIPYTTNSTLQSVMSSHVNYLNKIEGQFNEHFPYLLHSRMMKFALAAYLNSSRCSLDISASKEEDLCLTLSSTTLSYSGDSQPNEMLR